MHKHGAVRPILNNPLSKFPKNRFALGALPQRPAKGLSDRPLEAFGHGFFVFAWIVWILGLTAPFDFAWNQ